MFKKVFGILFILFLLVIIPTSFALENDTAPIQTDDTQEMLTRAIETDSPISVDYYFNSSSENDGTGTIDNPYNSISTSRLKEGSTIHLAEGEYELNSGKSLNEVTIIGESPEKTIIKYTGNAKSGRFTVSADNYLILKNVTFIGFNFDISGATFEATNTIFKNAVAYSSYTSATNLVNSASNSYGGAIYGYFEDKSYERYLPTIILDNCTFINNTAEYGGAILMNYGTLDITNSQFINNTAYNYGGAIATLYQVSTRLKNTRFINDASINDAGGAFYSLRSTVSATNVTIENCSATFGAGITSLNSTTAIVYLNATNNKAKYEGGVIYQMYNGITISDSYFKNNSARNGGAVYVNDIEIFKLTYNQFIKNNAVSMAGAVYQLQTRNNNVNNNNYSENKAKRYDNVYQSDDVVMTIGSGNITIYNGTYVFNGTLPSSYDLRDYDYVTTVKDQQSGGNCWAFGSLAALESAILKASGDELDLSEENMKNLMQTYSDYGWSGIETNGGGYDNMAIAYLTSWLGPVLEYDEQYDDYSMLSPVLNSVTHVQNIIYIKRSTYTDNDAMKEAIVKYGAVSTGIYYDSVYFNSAKNAYYYYGSGYANHAVAIVGWDDDYSLNNFYYKPAGNGAWIVKNSWGSLWGEDGYFYVSYYDTQLALVGDDDYSYAFVFNDSERYDKNYQYDIGGKTDYLLTENKTVWVQNIFNSTDNELLAAVSTYFRKVTDWELFIHLNDELVLTKNGTSRPGYHTINLGDYIPIGQGDIFKVTFKLTSDDYAEFAISEKVAFNKALYTPGISFFSFDGVNWTDLYNYTYQSDRDDGHYYYSQVASIKAFTILYELKPSIKLEVNSKYNNINVITVIYDQYDNLIHSGEVILNIEDRNHTVKIENGKANFTYVFVNTGTYDINASYKNAKANETVEISRIDINLKLNIIVDKDSAAINLESLSKVNTNVNISINDKSYCVNLTNGEGLLKLGNLDFGLFNVNAVVEDSYYAGDVNSYFNVTISKTRIIASDIIVYHNIDSIYSITLEDIYGNPVVNRQVSFIVGGKSYTDITDNYGLASVSLKLDKNSEYKMNIMFYGDNSYFASNANPNINVETTIKLASVKYLPGSTYSIQFLDKNGNHLSRYQVSINLNGVESWLITDENGMISGKINLNAGDYVLSVFNPETNEKLSAAISVIPRIINNKDISIYYGASSTYKVRVYADDGNFVKSGEIVSIKLNSKTYNVITDADGYASFKISLPSNKYTVTASYKGFKVSNKIIVKPVLTAKNISKKKTKKIKFSAKLVNSKGNAVKGKKLTFKVKGKKYTAKTNKKGVASISLKNLKKGRYSITTQYGKSKIKNTIRIK